MGKKRPIKNLAAIAVITIVVSAILVLSGCAATETSTEAKTGLKSIIPASTAVTIYQYRT